MNWDWLEGNWKQLIGRMQEKWGKLTHKDLVVAAGKRERLVGLLQVHYGYRESQAEADLEEFARQQRSHAETKIEDCLPSIEP